MRGLLLGRGDKDAFKSGASRAVVSSDGMFGVLSSAVIVDLTMKGVGVRDGAGVGVIDGGVVESD